MGNIVHIDIKAWWLLIVPFLLVLSLFVIALIMRGSPDDIKEEQKEEKKKKTLTSWITKKDILYWFLIVCLGAIGIFTFQYRNNTDVISHWSFAGTIVSIILAVVAIGFTLFQTLSSELSSDKIASSAEIISKVSEELNSSDLAKAGEVITNAANNMNKYHSELEEKIINQISTEINLLRSHQHSGFEKMFKSFNDKNNVESPKQTKILGQIDINTFVDEVLIGFRKISRVHTYAALFLAFKGVELDGINTSDFLGGLNSLDDSEDKRNAEALRVLSIGMAYGIYKSNEEWLTINNIYNSFINLSENEKKEVLLKIKKQLPESRKEIRYIENYLEEN